MQPLHEFNLRILHSRRQRHIGDHGRAVETLRRARLFALVHQLEPDYLVCEALLEADEKRPQLAEQIFSDLLTIDRFRGNILAHFWLGTRAMSLGKTGEGRAHLMKAIDMGRSLEFADPFRHLVYWSLNNLGSIDAREQRHEKVISQIKITLEEADNLFAAVEEHKPYPAGELTFLDVRYVLHYELGCTYFTLNKADPLALEHLTFARELLTTSQADVQALATILREIGTIQFVQKRETPAYETWQDSKKHYRRARELNRVDAYKPAIVADKLGALHQVISAKGRTAQRLRDSHGYILSYFPAQLDRGLLGFATPREELFAQTIKVSQDIYQGYLNKDSILSASGPPSLLILRGWASSIPLLAEPTIAHERYSMAGGGYLLVNEGYGLAIDPGHDFVRNLHAAGCHIRDISGVFVSHNHADHNSDLSRIDDLRYELFNREAERPEDWCFDCVLDTETVEFLRGRYRNHSTAWAEEMKSSHIYSFYGTTSSFRRVRLKRPGSRKHAVEVDSEVVYHGDVSGPMCGRFKLGSIAVGYTGDMSGDPDKYQKDSFKRIVDLLSGLHTLIAHMSQPDKAEYLEAGHRKAVHLGLEGTIDLVRRTKPRILLIGEFWGGLGDFRIEFTKMIREELEALRENIGHRVMVFPAALGLHLQLGEDPDDSRICCSACGAWTEIGLIGVQRKGPYFSPMQFLCERCDLRRTAGGEGRLASYSEFMP